MLDTVKIVLIGPAGAGKSSFINNCLSAINNSRIVQAPTGKTRCITKMFVPYYLDVKDSPSKVVLLDSRGYHTKVETKSMDKIIAGDYQCLQLLLDGDNPGPEGEEPVKIDRSNPKTANVVLFVFSAQWVERYRQSKDNEEENQIIIQQMNKMQITRNNAREAGIPSFVLLTCIDEMDPKIKGNILDYSSKRLDDMTAYLKNAFDIGNIFPVWNIPDNRPDVDVFQRCHILRILDQIIENALISCKNCQRIKEEMEKNKEK